MVRWTILALLTIPVLSTAQAPPAGSSEPFVVEYYYKTRWGFADEFIRLFKKNTSPSCSARSRSGISSGDRGGARFHATEDGRWDYRVHARVEERGGAARAVPEAELKRLFPRPGDVSA